MLLNGRAFDTTFIHTTHACAHHSLHSALFAGYAVEQALQENNEMALNLSLSFGAHVIGDLSGFGTSYLSPSVDVRWVTTWQFMLAVVSAERRRPARRSNLFSPRQHASMHVHHDSFALQLHHLITIIFASITCL